MSTEMKLIGFACFLLSLCFHGRTGTNCDSQQIQRCTANIRERGTIDSAVFERICQNVSAASSCIDNVICSPTDSDYRGFQNARAIIEFHRYVCESDHRKATYVRQRRCLQNATASADARRCFDKFGVSDDIGSSSESRQCRGLNAQTRCIFTVTNSQCGEDIARIVTTAYQKATPAYLPGCAVGRTGTNCDSQQIQRCTANIRERGTMDSAVYERICQNLTAASSCIDNVICAPTDSDYRDFQNARGIIEISRYVCQSDHRKATYVRQQRCLQNATASADARRCFDKFGVSDDIGSSSEFRQCRGLNAQTRCIFNVTNSQCGEDIARIVTTAYQKATPAYLPGCAVDTSYMPAGSNGMTSSMTSSAMMFISLLLLLLSRR